jgi:membrane-bound lytic murein transglycosylase A
MFVRSILITATLIAAVVLAGCAKPEPIPIGEISGKDYDRPLPPGQLALRKITDPAMIPDFSAAYYTSQNAALRDSIQRSLNYLSKPSSQRFFPYGTEISHARAVNSLRDFLRVLDEASGPDDFNRIIRDRFDVYISVGCDDRGTVLFTGYYTPIFNGSPVRTERFRYPIYKLPQGFQKDVEGNPAGGPWMTRREIESSQVLAGQELVWLSDPFETYVVTVQGSGQIRMPDGKIFEIGYAGNNGHDYVPIGRILVEDGKIPRGQLSLDAMLRYFNEHPEDVQTYCWQNPRYVFFKPAPGGPFGCLNEKVTTMHSIATDKDIFPRACLAFFDAEIPREDGSSSRPYRGFACDQDRGAAIRAAGRSDIFMGVGDQSGRRAGFTYTEGKLYYIFVKEIENDRTATASDPYATSPGTH